MNSTALSLQRYIILSIVALSLGACSSEQGAKTAIYGIAGVAVVTAPIWYPMRVVEDAIDPDPNEDFRVVLRYHGQAPPKEIQAAASGKPGITEFVERGGKFTGVRDPDGWTAGMLAARRPDAIKAFRDAGGVFTLEPNHHQGNTAAMFAAHSGAATIKAFSEAGGIFTNQINHSGNDALAIATARGEGAVQAYNEALIRQGGLFVFGKKN